MLRKAFDAPASTIYLALLSECVYKEQMDALKSMQNSRLFWKTISSLFQMGYIPLDAKIMSRYLADIYKEKVVKKWHIFGSHSVYFQSIILRLVVLLSVSICSFYAIFRTIMIIDWILEHQPLCKALSYQPLISNNILLACLTDP